MSRFEAVIFDLFGTLVHEFPKSDWDLWFERSGAALRVDPVALRREWEATGVERQTGALGDMEANVREIARRTGSRPTREQVDDVLEIRMSLYRKWFVPMPGVVETLVWLRSARLPVGLISMCAPDAPPLWRGSPLARLVDVEAFSSEIGMRKPDPEIYRYTARRLGVDPGDCLYVGDGSYRELSGAAAVGMHAVLVLDPNVDASAISRPEVEEWTGPRIGRISEIRSLLTE